MYTTETHIILHLLPFFCLEGFENFFPKHGGPREKKSSESQKDASAAGDTGSKSSDGGDKKQSNNNNNKSGGDGGSNNNNNKDKDSQQLGGLVSLTLFLLAIRALMEDETTGSGREVRVTDTHVTFIIPSYSNVNNNISCIFVHYFLLSLPLFFFKKRLHGTTFAITY